MKHAETVTFGGSGFARRAELRQDNAQLAAFLGKGRAQILPVWRGKPLLKGENSASLALVAQDHPALAIPGATLVFLGMDADRAVFAQDISAWAGPEQGAPPALGFYDSSAQQHPDLPADTHFGELRMIMARLSARDAELAATAVGLFNWHRRHGFCPNCGSKTEIGKGGWQRYCPQCARIHFPHIEPVVIMLITHGNDLLIGRSPGWPEGMYSLLAGFMEPGETVEAAVRREVFEETAIEVGPVGYLASQPWPFPASLMIGCRGEATSRAITIDTHEIEDARWVRREEIMEAWASKSTTLIAARKGAIANFLIRNWLSDTLD